MPKPCFLVIRRDGRFSTLLRDAGFDVINLELIRTEPVDDLSELDKSLAHLKEYEGLFFTSPNSASIFVERLKATNLVFAGKVYALGSRAATVLEQAGLKVVHVPEANTASELLAALGDTEFSGRKFLFVRGERSMRTIPEMLGKISTVDEIVVYRTIENQKDEAAVQLIRQRLNAGEVDWVCFFSPSGVESFVDLFGLEVPAPKAAVIGETTAKRAREAGLDVRYLSPRSDAADFAKGLIARCL